jgi:signal transduction histidine kinase
MSIEVTASPIRLVRVGLGPVWSTCLAVSTGVLSAAVLGFELARPIHATNPSGRAAIETVITIAAICTARLLVANFQRTGRLPDLLLLCALVTVALTDFVYCAAPALIGGTKAESGGGARLACELIISAAFAAAAFAPGKLIRRPNRGLIGVAALASAATVIVAELLEEATGSSWSASLQEIGIRGAVDHPVELAVNGVAAIVLIVSGLAFLRRAQRGAIRCGLLAGASFLLAGARLQYLAIPAVATNWITPREALRLAAYAMLLASAYWEYARAHRAEAAAAISSERERIARELHDGLAQDLVCIAAQSQRLGVELQREHPLMVAARNALATSRGVIADLSASTAPTTEAALRLIADDLRHRHGLEIDVRVEMTTALGQSNDLDLVDREHIVRIAREAIVNAALHGRARRVDVLLSGTGGRDLVMRIIDDGWGIADAHGCGMGLRTMRARAAALGGHLSAHTGPAGGTLLELTVP